MNQHIVDMRIISGNNEITHSLKYSLLGTHGQIHSSFTKLGVQGEKYISKEKSTSRRGLTNMGTVGKFDLSWWGGIEYKIISLGCDYQIKI